MMVIERERIKTMVLSTRGMPGSRAVQFGSIAEKVGRFVQCPVVLLHTPKPAVCTEQALHVSRVQACEGMSSVAKREPSPMMGDVRPRLLNSATSQKRDGKYLQSAAELESTHFEESTSNRGASIIRTSQVKPSCSSTGKRAWMVKIERPQMC